MIRAIDCSTRFSTPSQEVVPAGSDSGSAASCNVATNRSLSNFCTLQRTDQVDGIASSRFVRLKRIYWWTLPVSYFETRQPLISLATRLEAKFTPGIEFPKPGRLYVNTDPLFATCSPSREAMSRMALPLLFVESIPHSGDLALIYPPMTRSPGMSREVSSSSDNLVLRSPIVKFRERYTLTKVMLATVAHAQS